MIYTSTRHKQPGTKMRKRRHYQRYKPRFPQTHTFTYAESVCAPISSFVNGWVQALQSDVKSFTESATAFHQRVVNGNVLGIYR